MLVLEKTEAKDLKVSHRSKLKNKNTSSDFKLGKQSVLCLTKYLTNLYFTNS